MFSAQVMHSIAYNLKSNASSTNLFPQQSRQSSCTMLIIVSDKLVGHPAAIACEEAVIEIGEIDIR